jgi:hypothetical protein
MPAQTLQFFSRLPQARFSRPHRVKRSLRQETIRDGAAHRESYLDRAGVNGSKAGVKDTIEAAGLRQSRRAGGARGSQRRDEPTA